MDTKTKTWIKTICLWLSFVCVSAKKCESVNREPWSYEGRDNAPDSWGRRYPNCLGPQQSPIDINTRNAMTNSRKITLNMRNYNIPVSSAQILNNGHTVMITPTDGVQRTIQVDGKTFRLQQLHFHWNKDTSKGSEHAIDGKRYAAEAHFVHTDGWNRTAVVGVIYKAGYFFKFNYAFRPIENVLSEIPYRDGQTQLRNQLYLEGLLPKRRQVFYRYQGSLTTPGCDEGVTWTVFAYTSRIATFQMQKFYNLNANTREEAKVDVCKIRENVRPLQPLNRRMIIKGYE